MNALSKKNLTRSTHARFVAIQCHLRHMRPKAVYSAVPTPNPWSALSLMMYVTESEDDLLCIESLGDHKQEIGITD